MPPESLRARVARGLAWKGLSQVLVQLTRIGAGIVLARLLTPAEYGLAAMAVAFAGLSLVFADFGLGAGLVQRRELSEADRSTVFWTSAGVGASFALLLLALSGPIADFYGEDAVRPLVAVLSVGFLLRALGTAQSALLSREFRYRSLELGVIASTFAGAAAGIGVAAADGGAWAIVAMQLASAGVATAYLWIVGGWRPRFVFSRRSLRELGRFGAGVTGTRFFFYLERTIDNVLVGRVLGAGALGPYALSYNLMLVPLERVVAPLQDVLFPALSRLQDDVPRLAEIWLRSVRAVAAVTVPALAGLAIVASDAVRVVLGERWVDAIPVLQILAVVGLVQSLAALNGRVLAAVGRTGLLVRVAAAVFAASLAGVVAGLPFGLAGVAAGLAIANALVSVPLYTVMVARALGVPLRRYAATLGGVLQAAAAMAAVALLARLLLLELGTPAALRLVLVAAAGIAAYLPLIAWRAPEVVAELRRRARTFPTP